MADAYEKILESSMPEFEAQCHAICAALESAL